MLLKYQRNLDVLWRFCFDKHNVQISFSSLSLDLSQGLHLLLLCRSLGTGQTQVPGPCPVTALPRASHQSLTPANVPAPTGVEGGSGCEAG